ncbi:MAG: hypothetical protein CEN89_445 [Candidatus Berkelbacteria bacterium Licking1014_7]|uniref:DNA/RNA-binding protein Alba-like domain-containing protein n=1 Tax=Candidatus Berkelbacteria bacterium Licking1014_7 TaxID=2017147 RepID=A0A554LIV3_9BACT|nr:MAG: hypothetical protein CEN89_445 [Candidatus Berkelbacteria bacterium Licking1014_7]
MVMAMQEVMLSLLAAFIREDIERKGRVVLKVWGNHAVEGAQKAIAAAQSRFEGKRTLTCQVDKPTGEDDQLSGRVTTFILACEQPTPSEVRHESKS